MLTNNKTVLITCRCWFYKLSSLKFASQILINLNFEKRQKKRIFFLSSIDDDFCRFYCCQHEKSTLCRYKKVDDQKSIYNNFLILLAIFFIFIVDFFVVVRTFSLFRPETRSVNGDLLLQQHFFGLKLHQFINYDSYEVI